MGFKISMISVQQPATSVPNEALLQQLGFNSLSPAGETCFELAMYPMDKSINVGYFNNCLLICDDYHLTEDLQQLKDHSTLADHEQVLTSLFPDSEILTVACHSGSDYHMYSLVKNGKKIRYKSIASGYPLVEFGEQFHEEEELYALSTFDGETLLFKGRHSDDEKYVYTEDQMMEEFTAGVAKRHLGVMISIDEEALMNTVMTKYIF